MSQNPVLFGTFISASILIFRGGNNRSMSLIHRYQSGGFSIVLDIKRDCLVLAPFKKFFNINELPETFLENVKNLITHNRGATFEDIRKHIGALGYKIKYKVLNTCLYSQIPQNRERVYIVCFKNSEDCDKFAFPQQETKTLKITELLEKNVDKKYYYNNTKYYNILKQDITKKDTVYQWRRHYVRENKNKLCPTLTANMGIGGHNVPLVLDDDIRKLTPRECFRFQGFPDSFVLPSNLSDATLYKQIGNSVSVPVIEKIAKEIYKLF